MTMTSADRETLLSQWIQPSSPHEQTQQDRAERMIIDAVKAHAALKTAGLKVYAKGSYPNNTNVRRDSDVDIAVQCTVCQYYDYVSGQAPERPLASRYEGEWTPNYLRSEIQKTLHGSLRLRCGQSRQDSVDSICSTWKQAERRCRT